MDNHWYSIEQRCRSGVLPPSGVTPKVTPPMHRQFILAFPELIENAYIAGFFDGEGSVEITRTTVPRTRGITYSLRVHISQDDLRPLEWIQARWGGWLNPRGFQRRNGKVGYRWFCSGKTAAPFLRAIEPYLIVKQSQAQLGIQFQSTIYNPGCNGLSPEIREQREEIYWTMRRLKLEHIHSKHPGKQLPAEG